TDTNVRFIREAVAAGVRLIDTAHLYVDGHSEATIGEALAGEPRDGLVIATKGGYGDGRPEAIAAEIEQSLSRLRTDRIDLYYLHKPHDDIPIEDGLAPIVRARDDGRIRHIGA